MTHDNEQLRACENDSPTGNVVITDNVVTTDKGVTSGQEIVPGPPVSASVVVSETLVEELVEEQVGPAEIVSAEDLETSSEAESPDGSGPLPLSQEEIGAMSANLNQEALTEAGELPDNPVPVLQPSPESGSEGRSIEDAAQRKTRHAPYYSYWDNEREAKLLTPHKARPRYYRYVVKGKTKRTEDGTLGFPAFMGSRDWDDDFATIPKPDDLEDFRIIIEPTAWLKMSRIVAKSEVEVAWNAFVRVDVVDETIQLVVYDIFVPRQIGRPATFDVSAAGKAETLYAELRSGDYTEDEIDRLIASLRFHGHSHVWMGTSPSGVDNSYIRGLLEKSTPLFYIRAIANKAGRLELTLYLLEYSLKISDFPWSIGWDLYSDIDAWATEEVTKKVTREEFRFQPGINWGWKQGQTGPKATEKQDSVPADSTTGAPGTETAVWEESAQDHTGVVTSPEDPQEPVVAPKPGPTLWERFRDWWNAPF